MLRVKIPQGVLTGDQLDALADVGERYSRGFGHITTRQNIQFHFVKLHDVEPAMRLPRRRRADDARGVRQLGAQHHRAARTPASRPTSASTSRRTPRR